MALERRVLFMPLRSISRTCRRVLSAAVLLGVLTGCGVQTDPVPAESVLPAPANLEVWRRPEAVLVRWQEPAGHGGVRAYELVIERLPWYCRTCAPETVRHEVLRPGDEALSARGAARFYRLPLDEARVLLAVRVRARYGAGTGPYTAPAFVEGALDIPTPDLGAERAGDGSVVRLLWPQHRARVVYRVGHDGVPEEVVEYYRANVYRRAPGEPWPLTPLHGQPLAAGEWLVPLGTGGEAPEAQEYTVRYVDRFGNEGPPATPVTVPPAGKAP